ncbi:accessory Sec system translocase SecA2 [Limosilactobacillus sp. WF-MT5-A]|uniref:accessory Sec system translocase SecA2 n=1 Tax=Limosilactobacillus agrestis TaxID=2759748 RepID=UPI0015F7CB35|nr:accessory Sec system translocase SecA2 [Limosilactobacillus agrestis]MBB1099180.1 accessory Sec system translocase SecA2 [Limosilactobacillus agrestis]
MLLDQIEKHRVRVLLNRVNRWRDRMRAMSDEELQNQTAILREQLAKGKTLEQILPRAYATVREADYRILGLFPYDVQVMGAIVLHKGYIAEMKTGEGKTLTATMPLYLNALEGKGAMLVTPNGYLAERDETQLAPVYEWLGLTVSTAFRKLSDSKGQSEKKISAAEKRSWYNSDIIYTTASGLAFDFLFNNLETEKANQYLRPFNYAVIDEVDEVLLDEAESPFVVANSPTVLSNLYQAADDFVTSLIPKRDYRLKRRDNAVWLTYHGVRKAEAYFRINNLYDASSREIYRHIALALRAHFFLKNGHDYLVTDGKVVLLDEADGRLKKGIKVSTGLHQAIEQKEHVDLTENQRTAASITFPSLFGLFNKVSGMSGTVKVSEEEFINVYNMKVIQIPTNKPVIRRDLPDKIFVTTADKLMAAINQTIAFHKIGRPVLLVAGSVENSEIISELLLNHGIVHNVLNAFNESREAAMIREAGQQGAVTVATNMAGRGTDIKLGKGVKEKGGLAVIGTEMLSERVKLQLAGRAGRQGDPGTSQFYISLEDKYISQASTARFKNYYRHLIAKKNDGKPIIQLHGPRIRFSLLMLQNRVSSNAEEARKQTNKYETTMKLQRKSFHEIREHVITSKNLEQTVQRWIDEGIDELLKRNSQKSLNEIHNMINRHFTYNDIEIPQPILSNPKQLKEFLKKLSNQILTQKRVQLINEEQLNRFYRKALLAAMDEGWTDQVDYLTKLKAYIDGWGAMGRDPGYIYQVRAFNQFEQMLREVKINTINKLLLSTIGINEKQQLIVSFN